MEKSTYALEGTENLISPALVYYKDIILANTKRVIEMAGGPEWLWPHVKTHKTVEMTQMQIGLGITRFKCATIAEAEITAEAGAAHIILAYPLIGPNVSRYLEIINAFPQTVFYAVGDDYDRLSILADEACHAGINGKKFPLNVLIDVDIGMHRTGVSLDLLETLYERASALKGISLKGLHCYDGQCKDPDFSRRKAMAEESDIKVLQIQDSLRRKGYECGYLVMGGTPNFPCRTGKPGFYLSPGTLFVNDWGYSSSVPDLDFTPGAAIFCRVVSHQPGNTFTLDLGCKGIATDPAGVRGVIAGLEEAKPVFQSEEHWVFSLPSGATMPPIGSECYVIPAHVCPCAVLYPEIQVAQGGKITERWQISARNRRINY
ncbi:MAG: D-TA family PLP-dependent enzyme [Treponema sp.]|jgi:D-serine deaminase-like pyridoxal phosphate-dependent protein|nr:D-TA family PLP-dependent enzyme [Treponema sp.]